MPCVSNLVKKQTTTQKLKNWKLITYHNHDKYFTTPEYKKITEEIFDLRLKQANLESKSDIANFEKETDFDDKLKYVTSNRNELSKKVKTI